jgi:6-phosphogluconolactonase (cycloisomerase 2 family)
MTREKRHKTSVMSWQIKQDSNAVLVTLQVKALGQSEYLSISPEMPH